MPVPSISSRRTASISDTGGVPSMTMGSLHRVLTLLLEERVPISNLTRILESLADHAPTIKDPMELAERVLSWQEALR